MILWAQVLETSKPTNPCVLVEGISDEEQWHVARTLAVIKNGKVPIRIKNVNPFPIVVPPRRPLASVYQVQPSDVHGEKELVLRTDQPGTVEEDVQNVQLPPEGEHPVFAPKGEGLYLQPTKRIMGVLVLCNTRSPLALPHRAEKGIDRFHHPSSQS